MIFSIFNCGTHERVSDRSYLTADEANHDYHMNAGHTYVGVVADVAISQAQREHRPHSLIGSQRFWQPVAYGPGVVAWGYAYEGGSFNHNPVCDRPCAAKGLTSYRYPNPYGGWVMIGARDLADAIREANRSIADVNTPVARVEKLQVWDRFAKCYLPVRTGINDGPRSLRTA